jgi:putative transposase
VYLDEVGFSPSQPTNYSWTLPGERKRVPYESPQRRRLNVLAALVADGPDPTLIWWALPRTLTSDDLLTFLREALPPGPKPRVVVLDNASMHVSGAVKEALPDLERDGIALEYLPPYSPELNRIEPLFGVVKHHDLPERSYPTLYALYLAVSAAFKRAEERLLADAAHREHAHQLRQAA